MPEYKKVGGDKGKYLKFTAGESFEGIYQGFEEKDNPFYDAANPSSAEKIVDYKLEISGEERILSSTAQTLRENLMPLTVPAQVKIDCVQKGIKKFYIVWVME